ncbi:MAG: hypothetical protein ABI334_06785 [Candidatus Dormiibacterota bacterium]
MSVDDHRWGRIAAAIRALALVLSRFAGEGIASICRSVRARLTAAGQSRIESIWKAALEHQNEIAAGMNKEDLAQLRHLCLHLVENARKELGK